ncbi:MAG TPA: MFS transporter, partial [Actinomycetes bacterium]|nr:MFS transporter [Actinomycetes bacterium]
FVGLMLLPTDFTYWQFAVLIALNGIGSGLFSAPNTTAIMNSVPASQRGAASGMRGTFFNSGTSLSIGIFFSLMIAGLAARLPTTLTAGLEKQGVSQHVAQEVGSLPPVGSLFAAFLGFNPLKNLLGPTGELQRLPHHDVATLTGHEFFPRLINGPFHHGLIVVFTAAAAMTVVAALASLMRGSRYVHDDLQDASDPDDSDESADSVDGIRAPAGSQPATMA